MGQKIPVPDCRSVGCSRVLFDEILSQLRSSRMTWTRDGTARDVQRWLLDVAAGSQLSVNAFHIYGSGFRCRSNGTGERCAFR